MSDPRIIPISDEYEPIVRAAMSNLFLSLANVVVETVSCFCGRCGDPVPVGSSINAAEVAEQVLSHECATTE